MWQDLRKTRPKAGRAAFLVGWAALGVGRAWGGSALLYVLRDGIWEEKSCRNTKSSAGKLWKRHGPCHRWVSRSRHSIFLPSRPPGEPDVSQDKLEIEPHKEFHPTKDIFYLHPNTAKPMKISIICTL